MKIGIDFDGILTDFVGSAMYQMEKKSRGTYAWKSHRDCKSIDLWNCDFGITKKQYETWFKSLDSSFWASLSSLCTQEDIDNINKVSRWHSVYALTDTPCADAIHQRNLWLFNVGLEDISVIPTRHKAHVISHLDIDAMLDDSPEQLKSIAMTDCQLYHPIYPYNMRCAGEGVTSITDYLTRLEVL